MSLPRRPHLTERGPRVLDLAHDLADRRGDADLTPTHVMLGLLEEDQNVAVHILSARGVPVEALAEELRATLPVPGAPSHGASAR